MSIADLTPQEWQKIRTLIALALAEYYRTPDSTPGYAAAVTFLERLLDKLNEHRQGGGLVPKFRKKPVIIEADSGAVIATREEQGEYWRLLEEHWRAKRALDDFLSRQSGKIFCVFNPEWVMGALDSTIQPLFDHK